MVAYSFNKRFVRPILIGLGAPLLADEFAAGMDEFGNVSKPTPKRQTIRAIGKRRHARPGETLQLYTGMRTRQCRKIGEARCVSVQDIRIALNAAVIRIGSDIRISDDKYLDDFAKSDGFEDWADMRAFWRAEHGDLTRIGAWRGLLIKWEATRG